MNFLRRHWYDIGGILGMLTLIMVLTFLRYLSHYQLLMWLSLISLFFHQVEEYRLVGTFPGMVNHIMFNSQLPDRYPLNTNTAFIINVIIGWATYITAAIIGKHAMWLGMATMLVSLGNIIAHMFVFNIKGKTWFNAGMVTSLVFFVPCVYGYYNLVIIGHMASFNDYLIGIPLGILLNIVGVFKLISWLADKNTHYIFSQRQLLAKDRVGKS